MRLLDHPDYRFRDAALVALGRLGVDSTAKEIVDRLDHLKVVSGEEAAVALGRIGSPDAFDGLALLCRDPRKDVRDKALFRLDQVFPLRSTPLFLELLRDPMYPDRRALLALLVNAPPPGDEFKDLLIELHSAPDKRLAAAAIVASKRLNKGLDQRLKKLGIDIRGNRLASAVQHVAERSGWSEYQREMQKVESSVEFGGNRLEAFSGFTKQVHADPELAKRIRPVMALACTSSRCSASSWSGRSPSFSGGRCPGSEAWSSSTGPGRWPSSPRRSFAVRRSSRG